MALSGRPSTATMDTSEAGRALAQAVQLSGDSGERTRALLQRLEETKSLRRKHWDKRLDAIITGGIPPTETAVVGVSR